MIGWLFPPPAERRLLGGTPMRGPTPWVIAIMSFSIVLIAASGLALVNTAALLSRSIEARYSLEVPNGGGGADLGRLVAVVRKSPGVTSVEAVSEREMRQTLSRWLGPAADAADLPVPALVNFDIAPRTDLGTIERRIAQAAPGARIVAHRDSVAPLLHSLHLLEWLALGLVLLLGGAAAAAVVLAARGALDTHRFTIEVMHGIGATDLQVTRLFQRRIAIDALAGSVAGALAAGVVLLFLGTGAAFAGELSGGAVLHPLDLLILLLLPLALTLLATGVARAAVLTALGEEL